MAKSEQKIRYIINNMSVPKYLKKNLIQFINLFPCDRLLTPQEMNKIMSGKIFDCQVFQILRDLSNHLELGYQDLFKHTMNIWVLYKRLADVYIAEQRELFGADAQSNIYSLGDSLDKFAFTYNVMEGKNIIKTIPMSGNMYDSSSGGEPLKINSKKKKLVDKNLENYYINNLTFQNLVMKLKNNQQVLITDYGLTGKGMLTFEYMLSKFVSRQQLTNVMFIQFSMHKDYLKNNIKNTEFNTSIITIDISYYNSNSEEYGARCIPKYESENWVREIPEVYTKNFDSNYFLCNFHRFMFSMELTKLLGKC